MARLERWRDANEAAAAGAAEPRGDARRTRTASRRCASGRGTGSTVSLTSTTASRGRSTRRGDDRARHLHRRRIPRRTARGSSGRRGDRDRSGRPVLRRVREASRRARRGVAPLPDVDGRGRPRGAAPRPSDPKTNRLIADIWPGSGIAVLDFDRDGARGPLRRRRRALDPLRERRRGPVHRRHRGGGPRPIARRRDRRDRARRGRRRRRRVPGSVRDRRVRRRRASSATAATGRSKRRPRPPASRCRRTRARPPSPTWTATATSTSSSPSPATTTARCPIPPFDAKDGRHNFLYLNDGRGHFTDATDARGLGHDTRWTLSALFQDYDQDGREDLSGDERLRPQEPVPQRGRRASRTSRRRPAPRRAPTACPARGPTSTATAGPTSTPPAPTRSGTSSTSTPPSR